MVGIKAAAVSSGKPQVPTPGKAKPTVAGKATKPTAGTPGTPAPTPTIQAAFEAKVRNESIKHFECPNHQSNVPFLWIILLDK